MATRGNRPKPSHLRLVDGSHRVTRHGEEARVRQAAAADAAAFGPAAMPKNFKGAVADAWHRFIDPAIWLDKSREPAAIAFCELWAEFRTAPVRFPAAKHSQMRAYMSELGLTDPRRRRTAAQPKPADEFFDE